MVIEQRLSCRGFEQIDRTISGEFNSVTGAACGFTGRRSIGLRPYNQPSSRYVGRIT